jgi:hypothetical protein
MVSNHTIQVRLTRQQKEIALMNMQVAGKNSMSDYVRELIIGKSVAEREMLKQMFRKIMGYGYDEKNKTGLQRR